MARDSGCARTLKMRKTLSRAKRPASPLQRIIDDLRLARLKRHFSIAMIKGRSKMAVLTAPSRSVQRPST